MERWQLWNDKFLMADKMTQTMTMSQSILNAALPCHKVQIRLAWQAPGSVRLRCFNLCNFGVLSGGLEPLMPAFLSSGTDDCNWLPADSPEWNSQIIHKVRQVVSHFSLFSGLCTGPCLCTWITYNHTVQLTLSGQITVDLLSVPRTCLKTEGAQALEAVAPEPWSALPAPSPSVDSFCFIQEGAKVIPVSWPFKAGLTFYISHTMDLQTYFTLVLNGLNASLAC